jgi:hypothetical protein
MNCCGISCIASNNRITGAQKEYLSQTSHQRQIQVDASPLFDVAIDLSAVNEITLKGTDFY